MRTETKLILDPKDTQDILFCMSELAYNCVPDTKLQSSKDFLKERENTVLLHISRLINTAYEMGLKAT